MSDLFLRASREAWRFPSVVGDLTVEQLWQLPLLAKTAGRADLNSVAKTLNEAYKALGEESFVQPVPNQAKDLAEAKLELVKFIIATKQAEVAQAETRAKRAAERRSIMEALSELDRKELSSASREDLLKRLNALDA